MVSEDGAPRSSSVKPRLDIGTAGHNLSWYLAGGQETDLQLSPLALKSINVLNAASLEMA